MTEPYLTEQLVEGLSLDIRPAEKPTNKASVISCHGMTSTYEGAGKGERNDSLFRYACYWRARRLPESEIRALVLSANDKNSPPLSEAEVESLINSALRYPNDTRFLDYARTTVRQLLLSSTKDLPTLAFELENVAALAAVEEKDPALWVQFTQAAKGTSIVRPLRKAMKKARLTVVTSDQCPIAPANESDITLRSVIDFAIATFKAQDRPVDYAEVSRKAYDWFVTKGARFFRIVYM